MGITVAQVKEYMAKHECGLIEARRKLRFEEVRSDIDQFKWNGSRDALARALHELTEMIENTP